MATTLLHAHLDFETQSEADLSKVGADVYAYHPSTRVMAAGWAMGDDPVEVNQLGASPPTKLVQHVQAGGIVLAWNAPFEWLIWNKCWRREFPTLPKLPIEQMRCVMAKAYAMGLPGKLEKAAPALGLMDEKDMKGQRVMLQISQPRSYSTSGAPIWWSPVEHQEKYERMYRYCATDVEVEREADKRLMPLSLTEQELWFIDHRINQRGVRVDLKAALAAQELVNFERDRANKEIREVTGNAVATCAANQQLTDWLRTKGCKIEGVAKNDVTDLLETPDLDRDCRRALEIRQGAAKSSTAKFSSLILRTCFHDQRMRSTTQYHGAGTGRWAARGFQLHNLPRPKLSQNEIEEVFEVLNK